ncbi:hypothetical protein [Halorussus amylolyticus]|uniref:hypothetical protein n=1 Tax=Halorussus amylolyticus TaxID=1126242 RepID=UPI00104A2374|nr:hypothetical protein [Halorussus amylolyticus]
MDSTSPIASRIAGRTSLDSGTFFKPTFAMAFFTLVENTFVGRRPDAEGGHRRYRDRYHRSADGHGHPS